MAAPTNNHNAMKHGIYGSELAARAGVRIRKQPEGFEYVTEQCRNLASVLTASVLEAHGELNIDAICRIDSAVAWHGHAVFVSKVLRDSFEQLTPDQRVEYNRKMALAQERRANQVKLLNLDRPPQDAWSSLTLEAIQDQPEANQ